jgi:nucleoid-associated protein EbfC
MDLSGLMQMAQQLRDQLQKAQTEAAQSTSRGEAGGGMVAVEMNGNHEVTAVKIDPKVLGGGADPEAVRLLEDLVRAACNQAAAGVARAVQDRMGQVAKGLGIDPNMLDALKGGR